MNETDVATESASPESNDALTREDLYVLDFVQLMMDGVKKYAGSLIGVVEGLDHAKDTSIIQEVRHLWDSDTSVNYRFVMKSGKSYELKLLLWLAGKAKLEVLLYRPGGRGEGRVYVLEDRHALSDRDSLHPKYLAWSIYDALAHN